VDTCLFQTQMLVPSRFGLDGFHCIKLGFSILMLFQSTTTFKAPILVQYLFEFMNYTMYRDFFRQEYISLY